jgi:hypothetical protein
LGQFFQGVAVDSIVHIQIKASNETRGIEVEKLGDDGVIKFVWVELPR